MAPHRRAALWTIVSNTGWASAGDRRIMLSTSLVAVCCSRASSNSRVSRSTSVSWLATEEFRRRATFGALRRVSALWRCALIALRPVLPRRLIVAPEAQTCNGSSSPCSRRNTKDTDEFPPPHADFQAQARYRSRSNRPTGRGAGGTDTHPIAEVDQGS